MSPLPDLFDAEFPTPAVAVPVGLDHLREKRRSHNEHVSSIWSFPGSGGAQLYRWYGTLPRPLLERMFDVFDPGEGTFLDGFTGTGVALDVAAQLGIRGLGLDTNPLACMISEARLRGLPTEVEVLKLAADVASHTAGQGRVAPAWEEAVADSGFAYTKKWFRDDTLRAVLRLLASVGEVVEEVRVQRFFYVALAQVIRDVANVDPRCTHHFVTKVKPFVDPLPLWTKKVRDNLEAVQAEPVERALVSVVQGAFQAEDVEGSADLLLLHPPYLGVIHYNLIHRLATDLLGVASAVQRAPAMRGLDFTHANIKDSDLSTDNGARYSTMLREVAAAADRRLNHGGTCVVILGDHRHKGYLRHPFTEVIHEFGERGLKLKEMFIWVLQNNGGMHIERKGHFIDHNYIMAFARPSDGS